MAVTTSRIRTAVVVVKQAGSDEVNARGNDGYMDDVIEVVDLTKKFGSSGRGLTAVRVAEAVRHEL